MIVIRKVLILRDGERLTFTGTFLTFFAANFPFLGLFAEKIPGLVLRFGF